MKENAEVDYTFHGATGKANSALREVLWKKQWIWEKKNVFWKDLKKKNYRKMIDKYCTRLTYKQRVKKENG